MNHDAAADAGPQNDPEHQSGPGPCPILGLGQSEAIGVIGKPHRTPQRHCQIVIQGFADQPGGVGVLHQTGGGTDGSRHADPHLGRLTQLGLHPLNQIADGGNGRLVRSDGRHPPPHQFAPLIIQSDGFGLGAAQINADPHAVPTRCCPDDHNTSSWTIAKRGYRPNLRLTWGGVRGQNRTSGIFSRPKMG